MLIDQFVPPAVRQLANRMLGSLTRYEGPYDSWEAASMHSRGYVDGAILARVSAATRRVLRGEADFEQDGHILNGTPGPSHALEALLLAAALDGGHLSVLDFGGGLGSHFLRWRRLLEVLPEVHWRVVEQAHFVTEGLRLLADIPAISFATSVDQFRNFSPNVALASSVLHYLPDPMATLNDLAALQPKVIVIDRTPFSRDGIARILIQHVPRSLGTTSYPMWVLSHEALYDKLSARYRLLAEFPATDASIVAGQIRADHIGHVWLRKD